MVRRDPNAVDLAHQKLVLAEDVIVWPVRERGETAYRLEIPKLHKFFRVGYEEYVFISLLDGDTTVPQACGLAAARLGNRAPTAAQADSIQRWLLTNELAYLKQDGAPIRRPGQEPKTDSPQAAKRILQYVNPFWMKLPLSRSDRWMTPLASQLKWLFAPLAVIIGMLVMAMGLVTLVSHWAEFRESTNEVFSPNNWLYLLVAWVALKIVHELGHAVCCHRQGGEVREFGIVFILFAPLAYVDVTSCWRMASRWPRIAVAAAGMYIELVIAAVALMIWANTESTQTQFLTYNLVITAGLSTLLFNANALMRFDGYFILADLIDLPNLYAESTKEIKSIAKRVLVGTKSARSPFLGWRLWFLRSYGIAALIWKVVICVSLGIAASTMFSGAGVAITLLGIALWFGQPMIQLFRYAQELYRTDVGRLVRGGVLGSAMVLMVTVTLFWLPIPTAVRVPAVARFLPETLMRSGSDGFIREVYVSDSMQVRTGDALLEIENPELTLKLTKLKIALAQNDLRQRQAVGEHQASDQLIYQAERKTLQEQIAQVQLQTQSLRLVSPRDGEVVGRNLQQLVGKHVREGDPLMTIARASEKELIAVVHQEDVREVRAAVGMKVPVRNPDFRMIYGVLARVEPRATNRLPAPALSALEGGSLPVRQASEGESRDAQDVVRLLEPHFPARIELDEQTASAIAAGTRVETSVGYRCDPLMTRIGKSVRRLWHTAQDAAAGKP